MHQTTRKAPEPIVQTIYAEQLSTMRVLQAHAFNTTLRVFALDVLIAGGLLTGAVDLAPLGQALAAAVLAGFHVIIFLYLREKAQAYTKRKQHLRAIETYLVEELGVVEAVVRPAKPYESNQLFKGLRIYQLCVVLGGALALSATLFPRLLS